MDEALAQRLAQVAGELAKMMDDERPAPASLVGLARWEMVRCEGALRRLADQMSRAMAAAAAMAAAEGESDG